MNKSVTLDASTKERLSVFVNPKAGTAHKLLPILEKDERLNIVKVGIADLIQQIDLAKQHNIPRVAICGGDGSLALAASKIMDSDIEMAVIPGGTLNHFASRHDIPLDPKAAIEVALSGNVKRVPVGYVNNQIFLNTSSVGAYVQFVKHRNILEEQRQGYLLASLYAGIKRLLRLRKITVDFDGKTIRSPLIFMGIEERELSFPQMGGSKDSGEQGLHIIALKTRHWYHVMNIALNAFFRGIDPLDTWDNVENHIVQSIKLDFKRKKQKTHIALDGEIMLMQSPLKYRYVPDKLKIIT